MAARYSRMATMMWSDQVNLDQAGSDTGASQGQAPLVRRLIGCACLAIVALSWFSSMFGVRGFLPNHAGDLFGALMLYFVLRQESRRINLAMFSPGIAATFVLVGCTAAEFAQLWHWLQGTFDPLDVGCYAIGVAVGLSLDRWIAAPARR